MAVVVSEPCKELVGGGQNVKYIKECTELYLGNKGITKLRGFEPFVNLESLWLDRNKLKKLNNLDQNFKIRTLYAQDNEICTLKGSLESFKFLQALDLSNNQLRDLDKQLKVLERFRFLQNLNLKGNPVCEEPDYRLLVIHAMPSLKVLDQHVVAEAERKKARGMIGGDVATLTVAFGKRQPADEPYAGWRAKVAERSALEQDLNKEAAGVRDALRHDSYMRERAGLMADPHPDHPRGRSLPPNAGTARAMAAWQQQQHLEQDQPQEQQQQQQQQQQATGSGRGGGGAAGGGYVGRDTLVVSTLRPQQTELQAMAATAAAGTTAHQGNIGFEHDKYDEFLQSKAAGTAGNWSLGRTVVRV